VIQRAPALVSLSGQSSEETHQRRDYREHE